VRPRRRRRRLNPDPAAPREKRLHPEILALAVKPETWSSPSFQATLKSLKLRQIDARPFRTPAALFVKEDGGNFDPYDAVELRTLRAQPETSCAGPFTGTHPLTNTIVVRIAKMNEATALVAKLGLTLRRMSLGNSPRAVKRALRGPAQARELHGQREL
jgi:hypothetical protein